MNDTPDNWKYGAETAAGEVVHGFLKAKNKDDALTFLRDKRLTPLTLDRVQKSRIAPSFFVRNINMSLGDLASITRRISDLLAAGLPLSKSLELAHQQATTKQQIELFAHLAGEVRAGRSLSSAVANSNIKLPTFLHALVKTGENIGALPAQFNTLAAHYEGAVKMRREIIAQLVYPAALSVLILLTMIFLSFFVLPQFEIIFENASALPPIETRVALAAGEFIRSYLAFTPFVLLITVLGSQYCFNRYSRKFELLLLKMPVIGRMLRNYELGRYCRSLATMLSGGIALSEAMPLATNSVKLELIRSDLFLAETAVRTGEPLATAIARFAAPAKEVVSFLEVGDETGTLAEMSAQAAHFTEAQVNENVKRFMALLSPTLTAIMGAVTAGVIAAVMSGVLSLNDAIY